MKKDPLSKSVTCPASYEKRLSCVKKQQNYCQIVFNRKSSLLDQKHVKLLNLCRIALSQKQRIDIHFQKIDGFVGHEKDYCPTLESKFTNSNTTRAVLNKSGQLQWQTAKYKYSYLIGHGHGSGLLSGL